MRNTLGNLQVPFYGKPAFIRDVATLQDDGDRTLYAKLYDPADPQNAIILRGLELGWDYEVLTPRSVIRFTKREDLCTA